MNKKDSIQIAKYLAYRNHLKEKNMVARSANTKTFSSNYNKCVLRKLKKNNELGHFVHQV